MGNQLWLHPTRPFSSTTPQSPHNYTHLNHNGHSTLPPTCQALRHRPRRFSTKSPPSAFLPLCSVTPTNAPRPPTARKSSSRARKLPPRLRAGVHPLLVQPFKHTVLLPSSMPPVPSATRDPPT